MVSLANVTPLRLAARLLGAIAVLATVVAAAALLLPDPLADVFFAWWVLVAVGLAAVGAYAAWTVRPALTWLAAVLLSGLAIAGMMSIGLLIAPGAACLLGAACCLTLDRPRRFQDVSVAEALAARGDPVRALAGAALAAIGVGLVYLGAFERELFGACATETLACAIEVANPVAIGLTAAGMLAIALGSWMCYRQLRIARVRGWEFAG